MAALPAHRFVCISDVWSYYDSIDHIRLLDRVARVVPDRGIVNLVGQYLRRTAEAGGDYWTFTRGISLGCPLSRVIGAFFLLDLDRAFEGTGLFYVRFMDDIVVLAPTRWTLRPAVRQVHQTLTALGLATHPDKTFIGRVEHGFDFLGYHITPQGLSVAPATWQRFCDRAHRLYEREQGKPEGFPWLGVYMRRFAGWARQPGCAAPPPLGAAGWGARGVNCGSRRSSQGQSGVAPGFSVQTLVMRKVSASERSPSAVPAGFEQSAAAIALSKQPFPPLENLSSLFEIHFASTVPGAFPAALA
jgi:hypothetical protein